MQHNSQGSRPLSSDFGFPQKLLLRRDFTILTNCIYYHKQVGKCTGKVYDKCIEYLIRYVSDTIMMSRDWSYKGRLPQFWLWSLGARGARTRGYQPPTHICSQSGKAKQITCYFLIVRAWP